MRETTKCPGKLHNRGRGPKEEFDRSGKKGHR